MTANNITDGKVQALPIKPLKTHAGEAGRRSSITSFDDMLKAQGRTKSTKTSAVKHLDYSADTSKLDAREVPEQPHLRLGHRPVRVRKRIVRCQPEVQALRKRHQHRL